MSRGLKTTVVYLWYFATVGSWLIAISNSLTGEIPVMNKLFPAFHFPLLKPVRVKPSRCLSQQTYGICGAASALLACTSQTLSPAHTRTTLQPGKNNWAPEMFMPGELCPIQMCSESSPIMWCPVVMLLGCSVIVIYSRYFVRNHPNKPC